MIKLVLFDMDGVITDTEKFHFLAWQKSFQAVGYDLTEEVYVSKLQSRDRVIGIKNVINDASEKLVQMISDKKSYFYEQLLDNELYVHPDAVLLIETLHKKGVKMGVVSSSSYAGKILKKINMTHYFESIVSGTKGLGIRNKPHPDIYLYAIKMLNEVPEKTLILEDSVSGVTSGLKSGAFVYGVNRENNLAFDNEKYVSGKTINSITIMTQFFV